MARRLGLGFALTLGVTLTAVGATTAGVESQSSAAASRIIDRTLLCTVAHRAGANVLEIYAEAGRRDPQQLPRVHFYSGFGNSLEQTAVWAFAGKYRGEPATGHLAIGRDCARATQARMPLSSHGLSGGAVVLADEYECLIPRRILVRVRASFRSPTALRLDPRFRALRSGVAIMKEAQVLARTQGGKPLVFASVNESGKARLFTADSCIPE